ncbi:ubiquitin-related modifier 1 isoform X1 [Triplophysa dalaica]|uniref:ubiquitin-related modifier 1 isoform X1 n=1 Tax=Triplophysa dalaica TaxID=1582913 RepID=UPI0024DFD489|nr:ubiquitin-related modifier 1 isoform X1 [Triplophysa dalaica]
MAAPLALHLEFGGGAELLFDGVKNHHVTLPGQSDPCVGLCVRRAGRYNDRYTTEEADSDPINLKQPLLLDPCLSIYMRFFDIVKPTYCSHIHLGQCLVRLHVSVCDYKFVEFSVLGFALMVGTSILYIPLINPPIFHWRLCRVTSTVGLSHCTVTCNL